MDCQAAGLIGIIGLAETGGGALILAAASFWYDPKDLRNDCLDLGVWAYDTCSDSCLGDEDDITLDVAYNDDDDFSDDDDGLGYIYTMDFSDGDSDSWWVTWGTTYE